MWLFRYSVFGETPVLLYYDYSKELNCYSIFSFKMWAEGQKDKRESIHWRRLEGELPRLASWKKGAYLGGQLENKDPEGLDG